MKNFLQSGTVFRALPVRFGARPDGRDCSSCPSRPGFAVPAPEMKSSGGGEPLFFISCSERWMGAELTRSITKKNSSRPEKKIPCGGKGIGADSNRRRQRTTTPFEHGNRRLRARLESLRRRRSDHGAGGGGLVSVEHLEGFENKIRFGKFLD